MSGGEKKEQTLQEAAEAKKEEPTCQEKCGVCWTDFQYSCYHVDELDDTRKLCCWMTASEWGWLLLFFFVLYAYDVAFFALLLNFQVSFGVPVLYGYLAVFLVALIGIIVCVYMGHQQHLQMEATKRETRRAMEGDEKV
mmetsp:Transcript_13666/g.27665  ORF Transcript_13666/g.27665 Transcript_13666/m.27665 type:complete len:139 (+) Transcript_13666:89-505(+)|eukprot:CAMPEP_0167786200 /NCGR_PEP_ID=MMETSP0111_2-20121227/8647_1 /TAXON_ID=91324 /ORGANISM="Lotharella globosa, Strain CCCM811" /LENGTH=138 /DNA_ID=CAMNT_0007677529 /DNA_START=79 /DNA_END=495 /DNA_ORIENTATION=+